MKIKEAIAEIQNMKKFNYTLASDEVFTMAISALDKQDVKKPIDRRCPNCGSDDIEVRKDGGYVTTKFNFCPNCGQKIDWTEVDDG